MNNTKISRRSFLAAAGIAGAAAALTACGSSASSTASSVAGSAAASSEATGGSMELIVFAAASLTETLTAIGETYSAENPGVTFSFNFDSSGTLKTQIQEGADCDLFISAGQKQMNQLDSTASADVNTEGLDFVDSDSRVDLLENKVVLCVPENGDKGIDSFDSLAEHLKAGDILFCMGNSDVPVGQYTQKILAYYALDEEALAAAGVIKSGSMSIFLAVIIVLLMAAVLTAIVFVERAQRRIPISYAKRQIGRKMFGGQNTHLPLRVNTAGVIPPIFASSLLLFPATVGQFSTNEYVRMVTDFFAPHGVLYNVLYVVLIFFFCYFYTAIIIDPKDMAENLKKNGGFVPGIRPGERTQEYIDTVLSRLTLSGAVYISAISLLPMLMIAKFNVPFYFGGTSLLILVGVAMDFMNQVESHMISTQYQGLMNKAARKGGRM